MIVKLYKNNSENNRLIKNITDETEYICTALEMIDYITPSLILEANNVLPNVFNYAYIEEFKRYYYIKNITAIKNRLFRLDLEVDVLHTYSDGIRKCQGIIKANPTKDVDYYLSDNKWRTKVKTNTTIKKFSNGLLDTGEFILITAGG